MPCAKCGALWTEGVDTEELRAELKKRDDLERKIREEFFKKEWPDRKHFSNFILLFPALVCGILLAIIILFPNEFEAWLTVRTPEELMNMVAASYLLLMMWLFLGIVIRHIKEKSVQKKYKIAHPEYANSQGS